MPLNRGLVAATAAALFLLSAAVSTWSVVRHFEGGLSHEFCHYAEIGRNLVEGKGYRTSAVYPATLAALDGRGLGFQESAPVLDRFPLYAFAVAGAEALGGKNDTSVTLASIVTLALLSCAAFALGCRLFGFWEGALAGLLVALGPSFQRGFVLWGYPDLLFALLVVLEAGLLVHGLEARTAAARYWAAAGCLAGLGWLCRSNMALWAPVFVWALWSSGLRSRERITGAYAAGALLAAMPAACYNLRWSGSVNQAALAYGVAHRVVQDVFPLLSYRTFDVWDVVRARPGAVAAKGLSQTLRLLADAPTLWQMHLVLPLAVLGALSPMGGAARRGLRLMGAMLAVQALVFSVLRYEMLGQRVGGRYYLWFAPMAFLLAANGIRRLGALAGRPRLTGGILAGALVAFYAWQLGTPQGGAAHPEGLKVREWPELAAAAAAAGEGGLVVTNLPAQMAWYERRRAVGLPEDPAQLSEIAGRHRVDAVLISRLGPGELAGTPAWLPVVRDPRELAAVARGLGLPQVRDFGTAVLLSRTSGAGSTSP